MSEATRKAAPLRASRPPIYARARVLVDPATSEEVLALAPITHTDAEQPAWKRLRPGDRRRIEITAPRNPGFHAYAHRIAQIAIQNIDELGHLDAHHLLKRLQAEAGVECDTVMLDATSFWEQVTEMVCTILPESHIRRVLDMIGDLLAGQQFPVKWPRSLAFDSMDEDAFRALTLAICTHLSRRYWPSCTPEAIEAMAAVHYDGT